MLAVISGKMVVTEDWVSESVKAKQILDLADFAATDPVREAEWGTSLSEAIARGVEGLKFFTNWSFCFSPAVKKELGNGFAEMKQLCLAAGAQSIQNTLPRRAPSDPCTMVIIATTSDKDLNALHGHGWKVYSKEIITLSILRGTLDLDSDEFLLDDKIPTETENGKKRKR